MKASPSSVSFSARFIRRKSGAPSASSSALIWWLTAAWVTFSSAAASVKDMWRAAASKARSGFKGGNRFAMTPLLIPVMTVTLDYKK
jgi:hypothetical protein